MVRRPPWWLKFALGGAALGGVLIFAARKAFAKPPGIWDFASPLDDVYVTQGWWKDRSYRGAGSKHNGLDIRAKVGAPLRAIDDGVVTYIKTTATDTRGVHVIIHHGHGLYARYLHMNRIAPHVKVGTVVERGEWIGETGASGRTGMNAVSPHLHLDFRLLPEALTLYEAKFGKPTTGWGDMRPVGGGVQAIGVPAEPLVAGTYSADALTNAAKFGIPVKHVA